MSAVNFTAMFSQWSMLSNSTDFAGKVLSQEVINFSKEREERRAIVKRILTERGLGELVRVLAITQNRVQRQWPYGDTNIQNVATSC